MAALSYVLVSSLVIAICIVLLLVVIALGAAGVLLISAPHRIAKSERFIKKQGLRIVLAIVCWILAIVVAWLLVQAWYAPLSV